MGAIPLEYVLGHNRPCRLSRLETDRRNLEDDIATMIQKGCSERDLQSKQLKLQSLKKEISLLQGQQA